MSPGMRPDRVTDGAEPCRQRRVGRLHGLQRLVVMARRLSVNNGDVLRDAAVAGLGLVVLPTFLVGEAVATGALAVVLADYEFFDPSIHAIWPPNRQLSAKVRALVDFLTKRFGGVPYWDSALWLLRDTGRTL